MSSKEHEKLTMATDPKFTNFVAAAQAQKPDSYSYKPSSLVGGLLARVSKLTGGSGRGSPPPEAAGGKMAPVPLAPPPMLKPAVHGTEERDSEDRESMSLSPEELAEAQAALALSGFVGTVRAVEASLSELQRRHLQAEFLWSYEQDRQAKAEKLGAEVVEHGRRFAQRVDHGVTQLESLLTYLRARGAAERAYAAALSRGAELLGGAGEDVRAFCEVRRRACGQHCAAQRKSR